MPTARFAFLDGIRGIAAILVMTRHVALFSDARLHRSYLAVDVFFVLSGFVIASAYEERLHAGIISVLDFARIRLIRLYPAFFLSFVLSAVVFGKYVFVTKEVSVGDYATTLLATALMLPSHLATRAALFPLNDPYWSLFFELVANFCYAVVRPFLSDRVLVLVGVLAGSGVAAIDFHYGHLDVGFTWGALPILAGLSRSLFGIFVGVLIFRKRKFLDGVFNEVVGPWLAVVLIVVALASPALGALDPYVDLACIFCIFPLCVILASKAIGSRFERALLYLGSASYPMYVLHMPLGDIAYSIFWHAGVGTGVAAGIGFAAFMIVFCAWIERAYEIPVRRWLTARLRRQPRGGTTPAW